MELLKNVKIYSKFIKAESENEWTYNKYYLRIKHNNVTKTFTYKMGIGIDRLPTLEDLLYCLINDMYILENNEIIDLYPNLTIKEFNRLENKIRKQTSKLRDLFSSEEIEIIENYINENYQ